MHFRVDAEVPSKNAADLSSQVAQGEGLCINAEMFSRLCDPCYKTENRLSATQSTNLHAGGCQAFESSPALHGVMKPVLCDRRGGMGVTRTRDL